MDKEFTNTHTQEYYAALKNERNPVICLFYNIDGLGKLYFKWNELDAEEQILHDITYCRNLK